MVLRRDTTCPPHTHTQRGNCVKFMYTALFLVLFTGCALMLAGSVETTSGVDSVWSQTPPFFFFQCSYTLCTALSSPSPDTRTLTHCVHPPHPACADCRRRAGCSSPRHPGAVRCTGDHAGGRGAIHRLGRDCRGVCERHGRAERPQQRHGVGVPGGREPGVSETH
jgi:hypothetical protein